MTKTELNKMKKEELVNLALEDQVTIGMLKDLLDSQANKFKCVRSLMVKKHKESRAQIKELEAQVKELKAKLNDGTVVITTEEVLDNTLEDVAQQLSQMVNEENNNYEVDGVDDMDNVCEMNKKVLGKVEEVVGCIANHKTSLIATILNADYVSTPDVLVECGKEAILSTVNKLKGKRVSNKELKALTTVRDFIEEKKELVSYKGYDEDGYLNLLGKLGLFIKSIVVKVLKTLLATGKVIGKTAIVIGTLVSKAVVLTVVETLDAGKAIFTIAKDEYKEAILG